MPASAEFPLFMMANLTGMLLIAFEDGKLHWNEREMIVNTMRAPGNPSAEQILTLLDETAHQVETIPPAAWPQFFDPIRSMAPDRKILLLGLLTRVAFADGHLSVGESRLLYRIADWIECDRKSRETWKHEMRTVLAGSERRGWKYTGMENL